MAHDQMNFAQLPAGLMNIEPLKQYLKALESAVVSSAYKDRRMALLSLGRAVDSYFVTLDRAVPSVERAALYSYGWIKALLTLHDGSWEGPIAPLFSATNKDEEHAHRSILQLGLIAIAESILEQHRVGLLELVHSDSRGARFRYAVDVVGVEAEEANDYEWLSRNIRIRQEPILNLYLEAQPDIDRLMRKLVRRSYQDYIGYDADPIVDSHYLSLGVWVADRHFGQDSFDGDHRFGSLPFSFYRTTTAVVVGFALKHMRFCELLLKRHSQLRLSNVITIAGEAPRMAEELAGAMECTQSEATQALDMLTLTPEDTRTLLPNLLPDPAPPPYVQLGSRSVLKSMDGQLNQPFLFMLRKLRHRHSRDWDRAVESREAQFRTDLYGLFESSRFRRWERPIKIYYNDKTRTDIDAAIFDRQTGCLGLIQLKWQDPFGASLRERESRRRNFESGATSTTALERGIAER